jgi:hypothetical protein
VGSRIAVSLVLFVALTACKDDDKPTPEPDAPGVVVDGNSTCGGTVAYLAACTADDECESCLCKSFGHSKVCTTACDPGVCAAPSGGCSAGFCRP